MANSQCATYAQVADWIKTGCRFPGVIDYPEAAFVQALKARSQQGRYLADALGIALIGKEGSVERAAELVSHFREQHHNRINPTAVAHMLNIKAETAYRIVVAHIAIRDAAAIANKLLVGSLPQLTPSDAAYYARFYARCAGIF